MQVKTVIKVGVMAAFITALAIVAGGCKDRTERKRQIGFLLTLNHPYWQNMRLGART